MSGNYIGNNPNGTDYVLSDDYRTNNTKLFASTACVNNAVNEIKGAAYLPLGHFFLHPFPTPPDGCIVVNGGEYNRELYKDLFADAVRKNYVKPESEWQSIASANNGYCPWYSDGDGSTTFRTPKFAPYQKLALASGDAGKYYEAGLPNIEGDIKPFISWTEKPTFTQAFNSEEYGTPTVQGGTAPVYSNTLEFNASRSNSIYGNSTTVTPESQDWIVCVVAYGKATNVGEVDVANVMSAVGQVQANPNLQGIAHLIETWKSEDGTSWYRKYSDGWIEQGGYIYFSPVRNYYEIVTLPYRMSNIYYSINITPHNPMINENELWTSTIGTHIINENSFKARVYGLNSSDLNDGVYWFVYGY